MRSVSLTAVLVFPSIIGVMWGYSGIAELHRLHGYPFWPDGLYNVYFGFPPPPAWVIHGWDSLLGRVFLIVGSIVVPVWASVSISRNQHAFWAFVVMLVWTLITGPIGAWIGLHAMINGGFPLH